MNSIINSLETKLKKGKLTEDDIDRTISVVNEMSTISEDEKKETIEYLNNMRLNDEVKASSNEEKLIDSDDVKVGESVRHFKFNKKKIAKVAASVAVAGAVIIGSSTLIKSCQTKKNVSRDNLSVVTEQTIDGKTDKTKTLKPTLAFDAEDTNVLISNVEDTIDDMVSKGIEIDNDTLEDTIESLTNYYVWMNLNEMGPTYLSKLYQTDSTSYMEIFTDAMYWANAIRFDSMTSSVSDNTVLDMSKFIANKKDSELVSSFLNINARLSEAVSNNNKATIDSIVTEYRELVETKLLDHSSYTYGGGAMDLCFRLVYSGEQLLANYDSVIMDESLARIVNEDEFLRCYQAISISTIDASSMTTSELETVVQTNTSKKSDNVVYIVDALKDYMSRLNLSIDFSNEKSVADVMVEVSKYIRDNNILSKYKANPSLEELLEKNYNATHDAGHTLTSGDMVTSDGNYYVPASEINRYGASSIEDYENKVREETENELRNQDTFTDSDGNVKDQGSSAEDYANDYASGYEAGSRAGSIDGNNGSTMNPNTNGSKGYVDGYYKAYVESYNEAKAYRESAANSSSTEFTPSTDNNTTEEIIEQGTLNSTSSSSNNNSTGSSNDISNYPEIGSTTDEVIEEGYLNYTLTEDELYQVYYEVIYGGNNNYTESNTKVK